MIELFEEYLFPEIKFTSKTIYSTYYGLLYKCDGDEDEMITAMTNADSNDDT